MRISGGNFLSPRNEGLENGTAKPCHSEARSAVRIALPQPLAGMNFSEGLIQTLTTMRSSRVPSRGMSEAKGEQEATETLSFRCDCERCRFMRGRIHLFTSSLCQIETKVRKLQQYYEM